MRANGAQPERVVIVVKDLAQDTGVLWAVDGEWADCLVGWVLDQYYDRPK